MAFVITARGCAVSLARSAMAPVELAKVAQYMGRCYAIMPKGKEIAHLCQNRMQKAANEMERVVGKKPSYVLGGLEHSVRDPALCKKNIALKVQAALDKDDLKGIFGYIATTGGGLTSLARKELYEHFCVILEKQMQVLLDLQDKIEEEVRMFNEEDMENWDKAHYSELYEIIEERFLKGKEEPRDEVEELVDDGPVVDVMNDGGAFF